jgi:uncharacterized protein
MLPGCRRMRRARSSGIIETMTVTELYVFPVKGAGPVPLRVARLDAFGIEHDRRWMIVDSAGRFITQRNAAELALLHTDLEPDALVLRSHRAGELRLPLQQPPSQRERVRVWNDDVDAVDTGRPAAAFLTVHLGFPARLLYMPATTLRQADPAYAQPGDRVSFADGFPLLLITQESLDELDHRLEKPVPMLRFRPNVVVAGAAPHAEDTWRRIRIGEVDCDVVKPCARCVVTTIDPATAATGVEPLRTLATYRRWDGKVWFGQNVIHRAEGLITVGDSVQVLEAGAASPPLELLPA